jgi:hypothetical protein
MNREQWHRVYRSLRVARRELAKAELDGMVYGSGFVRIPIDGDVQHVPLAEALSLIPSDASAPRPDPASQ